MCEIGLLGVVGTQNLILESLDGIADGRKFGVNFGEGVFDEIHSFFDVRAVGYADVEVHQGCIIGSILSRYKKYERRHFVLQRLEFEILAETHNLAHHHIGCAQETMFESDAKLLAGGFVEDIHAILRLVVGGLEVAPLHNIHVHKLEEIVSHKNHIDG